MAKIEEKQPIVQEISELLDGSKAAVLVDYRGITVEQDTALRKQLREAGVTYRVYKNTLLKIAVKGTDYEALSDDLKGPTAIAVSKEDAAAPAKIIYEFAKKTPIIELKSGVVEGTYYGADTIGIIATIPSRETLLSRFLGSLKSPVSQFARVIQQIAESKGGAAEA